MKFFLIWLLQGYVRDMVTLNHFNSFFVIIFIANVPFEKTLMCRLFEEGGS